MTRQEHHPVIRKVCPPTGPGKRADYGIYHEGDLVGMITWRASAWKLWKVKRGSRIEDPGTIKHYTDHLDPVMTFGLLKDAKSFARRAFTTEYLHQMDRSSRPAEERRECGGKEADEFPGKRAGCHRPVLV